MCRICIFPINIMSQVKSYHINNHVVHCIQLPAPLINTDNCKSKNWTDDLIDVD